MLPQRIQKKPWIIYFYDDPRVITTSPPDSLSFYLKNEDKNTKGQD